MTLRSRLLYLDYGVWHLLEQGGPIRFVTRGNSVVKSRVSRGNTDPGAIRSLKWKNEHFPCKKKNL